MREETLSSGETRSSKAAAASGSSRSSNDNDKTLSSPTNNNTIAADEEFVAPEFEEDAYYSSLAATPSFDELDDELASDSEEILVHWHHQSGEIIEEIEAIDFRDDEEGDASGERKSLRRDLRARIRARLMRMVKSGEDAALHRSGSLSPSIDGSVVSELQGLTPEEQERQKAEWQTELARIEDEIQTLREVLNSKVKAAHELKRKLGISVWRELSSDVNQGLKNVKDSQVYQNVGEKLGQFTRTVSENSLFQKTESVIKTTAEKTTSILGGFGSGLSMKIGQMRNSDSFRSLEEKMGSAYENVKGRMTPSRSNSTQSFDEALREAGASRRASAAPSVTSPTIPEDKMLS